jgi:uncharacterized membrane protein YhfC
MSLGSVSLLTWLLIVWAILTVVFVSLLIYRSMIAMHEEDQLYLSRGEAALAREQEQRVAKLSKLRPYLAALGTISGVLLLVIAGMWLYQGLLQR